MKKLKWILLFIMVLLAIIFLFATCKKTNALKSELGGINVNIRDGSMDSEGFVVIYDFANNNLAMSIDFCLSVDGFYLNLTNDGNNGNVLKVRQGTAVQEQYTLNSRIIQVQFVVDTGDLYCIIYQLDYTYQTNQGTQPIVDGVSRTMVTRYNLGNTILNAYSSTNGLTVYLLQLNSDNYMGNFLINYSYIDYSETPQDINNWVNNQILNSKNINKIIDYAYWQGYTPGYDDGYEDGDEHGYNIGYDAGEDAGYDNGYYVGRTEGLAEGEEIGYGQGYDVGYADGQAGNTAITPVFNTLSGVFSVVGSVLAIELVPHVPLGIFILVPLFFAAVGLILWIWRRN